MARYLPERQEARKTSPLVLFSTLIFVVLLIFGGFYGYYMYNQNSNEVPASMVIKFADLPPIVYDKGVGDPHPAKVETMVSQKDVIASVKRPRTVLTLDDKHSVRLGPSSEIQLNRLIKTKDLNRFNLDVVLKKGKIWVDRVSDLNVEVDVGRMTAVLYGTRFEIEKGAFQKVIITAWEGEVGIKRKAKSAQDIFILRQGQRVTFMPGQKPQIEKISIKKLTQWEGWNIANTTLKIVAGQVTDVKIGYLMAKEKLEDQYSGTADAGDGSDSGTTTGIAVTLFGLLSKAPIPGNLEVSPTATPDPDSEETQTTKTGYTIPSTLSTSGITEIPPNLAPVTQKFVATPEDLASVQEEVSGQLKEKFNMEIQLPVTVEFSENPKQLSEYRFDEGSHIIGVTPRLPLEKTYGMVAYWMAYAWILENGVKTNDYKYNCGFSGWTSYKLTCEKKYYTYCREVVETPRLGNIVKFIINNIEAKFGEQGVLEYCVMGIDIASIK